MGVEVVGGLAWRASKALTVDTGAAGLFTGELYRQPEEGNPDDLYAFYLRIQLEL